LAGGDVKGVFQRHLAVDSAKERRNDGLVELRQVFVGVLDEAWVSILEVSMVGVGGV